MKSAVIAALTRVGLTQTGPLLRTVALRESQVVAQKFLFDDG